VKANAISCKECGSDSVTGWSNSPGDMSFVGNDEDDYKYNLKNEFGHNTDEPWRPSWIAITGFILLMLIVFAWVMR